MGDALRKLAMTLLCKVHREEFDGFFTTTLKPGRVGGGAGGGDGGDAGGDGGGAGGGGGGAGGGGGGAAGGAGAGGAAAATGVAVQLGMSKGGKNYIGRRNMVGGAVDARGASWGRP